MMEKRNIIVADSQGFCWGVRRALEIVEDYGEVSILGHLIHNRQVVEKLTETGKVVIESLEEAEGNPVVVTAHGTRVENFEKIKQMGLDVIDTTCPLVSAIYKAGSALETDGYHVVIIGDAEHVEVQGIASRMKDPIIIGSEDDVRNTEFPEKVGVVCQSTYSQKKFEGLVALIEKKVTSIKAKNTICSPTIKRQTAAEELVRKVELMVVVGGYHSSNTKKLAELSKKFVDTYHIETADELKPEWFKGKKEIGITAGASTPDWIIADVKSAISSFP